MRRIAAVAVAGVIGLLGAHRLAAPDDRRPVELSRTTPPADGRPFQRGSAGSGADDVVDDAALASVARRWVTAMWTRPPGDPAFAWLDRVADITAADLDAELRMARPWLDHGDVISSTVDIAGVYPDALDRATLTVTCVAHRLTPVGWRDESCATTVTVASAADARLVVVAVR